MPFTNYRFATCGKCGTETAVTEVYWPATRWDPPDGELSPEECKGCSEPFGEETQWREDEPPDPY